MTAGGQKEYCSGDHEIMLFATEADRPNDEQRKMEVIR